MKIFGYDISVKRAVAAVVEVKAERHVQKNRMRLSEALMERANAMDAVRQSGLSRVPVRPAMPIIPYAPPKKVCPPTHVVAMDAQCKDAYAEAASMFTTLGFPGFAYLSELTQLTEYRDMSERLAAEMTRKWIKFRSTSDDDKSDRIKGIEEEMKRLGVRKTFRRAAELDGEMGRGQIFINLGNVDGPELAIHLMINEFKITKDSLREIKVVEPITTYPFAYNSTNPLAPDFYKPSSWYVYGQPVHQTRLLTFISRELPDILKPAYNFSGISLSQLAEPYVNYWYDTRDSVGAALKNFSTSILQTNMQNVLAGGDDGSELMKRAQLFNQTRDNKGLFLLDKDDEAFVQVNTPLGGLDQLQAQAQEHMASVAKIPLVVLLGISPSGLNASSEGELKVFYDYVADQQEKLFRTNLETLVKIIQLSKFGDIDEEITFDFVGLWAMTDKELALIRQSNGTTDIGYINSGVISPEEVRGKIAKDPESGYDNLDVDHVQGKLRPQAVPGVPGTTEGKPDESKSATPPAKKPNPKGDSAYMLMVDAMAMDGASVVDDSLHAEAVKHSGIARMATSVATKANTRNSHLRAVMAHQRALDAHQCAMLVANPEARRIYTAYVEAHTAAIAAHKGEA